MRIADSKEWLLESVKAEGPVETQVAIEKLEPRFAQIQRFHIHCGPLRVTLHQHRLNNDWHCNFTRGFIVAEQSKAELIAVAKTIDAIVFPVAAPDYQI